MRRHGPRLLVTALLGGALATMTVAAIPVAHAAAPALTGTVSCALSAASTFNPPLNYQRGRLGKKVGPNANAKWSLEGTLTGCSGSQTGGNPRTPGPIDHGDVLVKGKAVGHQCTSLTASGMTIKNVRIKWFDAAGNTMPTTRATGAATVTGLGNGSPYISFNPLTLDPNYVPPGIITVNITATGKPNARAFPGQPLTMTAVADQTVDSLPFICHTVPFSPGLTSGFFGLDFNGVNGPSSTSIS
jgi:hypothetical protein